MENNGLDLEFILQSCGIGTDIDDEILIENLINLSDNYTDEELIEIYNHLMGTVYNPKVLMQLIRLSDKYRDKSSLSVLCDLLLMRINLENTPYDFDDLIVQRLCEKGYVDDEKFAEYYVENRFVKKGISKKRLKMELMKKGISQDIIEEVLDGRDDEEEILM